MNFNSLKFLIFYPIVAVGHYLIPQKYRWIFLLIASYYFYMSWNPELVFLILFTTAVSYGAALLMEKTERRGVRKLCMLAAVVSSLGVLFFFKYFNFLSVSVTAVLRAFSLPVQDHLLDLILPVGISFYTFQTLSYVIDVYRGTIQAEHHFGYYALFVSFFPQLVAGPIERPQNLLPQLKAEHRFTADNFTAGLRIMLAGFFKKVVIADQLAHYVVSVYSDPAAASAPAIILATFMFTFQVYCDFSGYTDIAVGCARIMDIRLMQNFNLPFSSHSIHEFWQRWHISLTSWFQDYIFYPIAMNKKLTKFAKKLGKKTGNRQFNVMLPQCVALFITFVLSGLWHGAAWTFVLWGTIHGVYQVIERLTEKKRAAFWSRLGVDREGKLHGLYQIIVVFLLCNFALIFFRANSVADLGVLLGHLFTAWRWYDLGALLDIDAAGIFITLASLLLLPLIDRQYVQGYPTRGGILQKTQTGAYVLMAIIVAWVILMQGSGAESFIYFQF